MASVSDNLTITDNGTALITRCLAESKKMIITEVRAGNGASSAPPHQVVTMAGAKTMSINLVGVAFDSINNNTVVTCSVDNQDVTDAFDVYEYGIFAKAEGDTLSVLFAYIDMKLAPTTLYAAGVLSQTYSVTFKLQTGAMSGVLYNSNMKYNDDQKVSIDMFSRIMTGFLGSFYHTLSTALPDNSGDWGWLDGGEIKKSEYPALWESVRPMVETAIANVTSGIWEYLGSNNLKSYYGWYKGTTDEYFRKPNITGGQHFLRPTTARSSGVFQTGNIQSHTHGANSASAGSHNHTTDPQGSHSHSYYLGGNGGNDNVNMPSASDVAINYHYYTTPAAGAHTHTATTAGAHTHGITIDASGGAETTPNNISVNMYTLLRIRGV